MTAATSRLRRRGIGAGVAALVGLGTVGGFAGAAHATADFSVTPVSAQTRFGTAAAIAGQTFPDGVDTAVLVNAYSPADALAASYVAGSLGAALLVTDQGELNSETETALESLGVSDVYIVGGSAAVSADQQGQLEELGYTVDRFSGATRTETALDALNAAGDEAPTHAFVVRAFGNPADALAAGPIAYKNGVPILLVPGAVDQAWIDAVKEAGITEITPLGGTAAIPNTVVDALDSADFTVNERIAGASGPETAVAIAEESTNWGFLNTGVGIARGDTAANAGNAADALVSSQWLAKNSFPLLLTESNSVLGAAAEGYLADNAETLTTATAFGGPAAINASVIDAANEAGQGDPVTPPPATNQSFTVTGGTASTTTGTAQTYTVAGITGTTVDIALVPAENVTVADNGVVTFADAETNADGDVVGNNQADLGTVGAQITSVNGTVVGSPSAYANAVTVTDGKVTFVVNSTTDQNVVPVVFADANTNNALDLGADNAPVAAEAFGVASAIRFIPAEAAFGSFGSEVVSRTAIADNYFVASVGGVANQFFFGGDKDTYSYNGAPISLAQFKGFLTAGDTVSVNYNPDKTVGSSFSVASGNDVVPAPAEVTATVGNYNSTAANAVANDVRLSWTAAPQADVVYDVLDGVTVVKNNVSGTSVQLDDQSTATHTYTVRAESILTGQQSTATATDPANTVVPYIAPDASAPHATSVIATVDTTAPGIAGADDVWRFVFDEPIAPIVNGDIIRVQDANGEFTNVVLSASDDTLNQSPVTIGTTTYAAGTVLTVTPGALTIIGDNDTSAPNTGLLEYPLTVTGAVGITDQASSPNAWNPANDADRTLEVNTSATPVTNAAPFITAAAITTDASDNGTVWDEAGDALTVTFSEAVTVTDTTPTEAEVNAILGTSTVAFGTGTVTVTGSGTNTLVFTVTAGGADLGTGLASGDAVDGGANAVVDDLDGTSQVANPGTAPTIADGVA